MLLMCLLLQAVGVTESVRHEESLAKSVEISISADDVTYYVHEPIRLEIGLRNHSDAPVRGFFRLVPSTAFAEVQYRRVGLPFSIFKYPMPVPPALREGQAGMEIITDGLIAPKTLAAGAKISVEVVLAFDAGSQRFVLPDPGEYEFKFVYQDVPGEANAVLESDVVRVNVARAPERESEAAAAYTKEVAFVAQFDWRRPNPGKEAIAAAAQFLELHPDSVYSEDLRDPLYLAVKSRVIRKEASKEEQELYKRLQIDRPPRE